MEGYCSSLALCLTCKKPENSNRSFQVNMKYFTSPFQLCMFLCAALFLDSAEAFGGPETLCGGELVDTLQFVCGDRGFYFSRPQSRNRGRINRGIVEECCFRSCDLALLETYCAKPAKYERDLSATTSFQMLPALNKDGLKKSTNTKHFKYESWQKKHTQRLRRGASQKGLTKKLRLQAKKAAAALEEVNTHKPLINLQQRQPIVVLASSEMYASHK